MLSISGIRKQRCIYRLLCCAIGHEIPVAQIIDLDVLDVIAIGHVHLAVESRSRPRATVRGRWGRRVLLGRARGQDRWDVDMLNALARLELGIDPCRGGRCMRVRKSGLRGQGRGDSMRTGGGSRVFVWLPGLGAAILAERAAIARL